MNARTQNLENIIKQYFRPLRDLPSNLLFEVLIGYKIILFNEQDKKDKKVLQNLSVIAENVGKEVNKKGIAKLQENEVGNIIRSLVKKALNAINYQSKTPKKKNGSKKPEYNLNLQFIDEFGRLNYLECKTFNINNLKTTQRSFFVSPSEDFKVTTDAHHFVITYEIYVDGREGNNNIYKCGSWKILSIENLEVDVKYEFNSDNARLYADEMILAEGNLR